MSRPDPLTIHPPFLNQKIAGVMIPLFSIRTAQNFGIGSILDLIPFIDWVAEAGLHVIQILPTYETAPQETSPYQALSAFAMDPIYLSLNTWDDFEKSDAARLALDAMQEDLSQCRASQTVAYELIRPIKGRLLFLAFDRFLEEEWEKKTPRGEALQKFIEEEADWLEDYALFRLLKEKHQWRRWEEWPSPFRDRDLPALQKLKGEEGERLLYFKYLQWAFWEQWKIAREHARRRNVLIMGDLPFLVSRDSADVWRRRNAFSADDAVGAPPDAFNAQGQDWGLPLFRWEVMEERNFFWHRRRIRQARRFYDLIRLDHVVGFYRVWVIPKAGVPHFEPPEEERQAERGRQLLNAIVEEAEGLIPIAEDLGVIPDFVYRSLEQFQIAGHKIIRWQKEDDRFRDPKNYPFISLATTGTHDTSPLVGWWKEISLEERAAFLRMLAPEGAFRPEEPFSDRLHEAILDRLIDSGAGLVILPIQDILGLSDQINLPATVGYHNWRFRLPAPLDALSAFSPYKEKLAFLKTAVERRQRRPTAPLRAPGPF